MQSIRRHGHRMLNGVSCWRQCPGSVREMSHMWKQRRDADHYANMAIDEGLRSRAAYKLIDIDSKFDRFLRQGAYVVDLGAAPGGFSLVAAQRICLNERDLWDRPLSCPVDGPVDELHRTVGGKQKRRDYGALVCVDVQDVEPIPGAQFVRGDFTEADVQARIRYALGGQEADVVLSDMSPSTMGDKVVNHSRIMDLAEEAVLFARSVLRNGGVFVCKVFNGAGEKQFRESLRQHFVKVKAVKPDASRRTSPEMYYVAAGFVPEHLRGASACGSDEDTGINIAEVDELMRELESLKRPAHNKP